MELEGGVILAAENVRPGGVGPVITHVLQLVPLPAGAGTRGLQAPGAVRHFPRFHIMQTPSKNR